MTATTLRGTGHMGRFLLLGIGVWLHAADSLVTATIAPAIVLDLGGVAYINWTISLYQVGAIVAGAAAAVLCRAHGIKRLFVAATLLYFVGCVVGAAAPTMAALILARLVQGLGGGMLLSLSYVAVEAWFDPNRWAHLFAITATIWGGGSLLGPLIGGAFAGPGRWRLAFGLFAAQAAVLAAFAAALMPAMPRRADAAPADPRARWPLAPLALLSVATLIIAESGAASGGTAGVPLSLSGCLLGIVLLGVAARLDRRARVRLLPAQLLDLAHPVGAGLFMVFCLAAATTGFWAYGPLILKILFDTKPLITGYVLAGEAVAWSLATMAAARATIAHDRGIVRGGALAIAAGAAGFAYAVPSGSLVGIVVCGLLQGAGFGVCWPTIVRRTVRFSHAPERPLASAAVSTIQRIGYAVGTAAVGIAANMSGLADATDPAAARRAGFWVFAAFLPLLALGVWSAWRFTDPARETPA